MTTHEQYGFLAHMAHCEYDASLEPVWQERWLKIEQVLRAMADGAVLCKSQEWRPDVYDPLDPQP